MIKDNWLICFDEVQHTDYGSSVLLHQVFEFMLSRGQLVSQHRLAELSRTHFVRLNAAGSTGVLLWSVSRLITNNTLSTFIKPQRNQLTHPSIHLLTIISSYKQYVNQSKYI